jgi:hypothetical protein
LTLNRSSDIKLEPLDGLVKKEKMGKLAKKQKKILISFP